MTTALAPRRMFLCCLIVLGALLFAGAGHAAAAQQSTAPQWTMTVHHGPAAYADGPLTVARRIERELPVAHASLRPAAVAQRAPVAYADGLLTVARHHSHHRQHHRRILAAAA